MMIYLEIWLDVPPDFQPMIVFLFAGQLSLDYQNVYEVKPGTQQYCSVWASHPEFEESVLADNGHCVNMFYRDKSSSAAAFLTE